MTQEKAGFGEQALNKIAEMALASQLEEAEQLEVQIKTELSKLAHGEVNSINIKINGLVMQYHLRVEELQVQINRVIVKPLNAVFGKIQLTEPSTGIVRAVFNESDLTRTFNSKSFLEHLHQMPSSVKGKYLASRFQQVKCNLLTNGNIAFNSKLILNQTGEAQALAFTTTPHIRTDGHGIVLHDVQYVEGKESLELTELTAALVAQVSEVLSLRNFEKQGMTLQMQQLDVTAGKLTWQASAEIEHFPAS